MKKNDSHITDTIKSLQELLAFMKENPMTRRWYVTRIFSEDLRNPYIDLYYAAVSEAGRRTLAEFDASTFLAQTEDVFEWWQPENFDQPAHLPLSEFRKLLQEYGDYRTDQPIEEGMVFIEIWRENKVSIIPFSYQAREASKNVYQRLLGKTNQTGKKEEEK
jgi:hypothetical protein